MKRCNSCGIDVRGALRRCPLCEGALVGSAEAPPYPDIQTVYRQFERVFRIVLLAAVVAGVGAVTINLMIPKSGGWSVFVLMGIACFGIFLVFGVRRIHNIPHFITNQAFFVAVLSVLWDWMAGWSGWSVNYVLPIACIVSMLTLAVVGQVRQIPVGDYVVWLATVAVFGVVPLILYLVGALYSVIPSLLCIAASAISLAAIILFKGKDIRYEMSKRFHV